MQHLETVGGVLAFALVLVSGASARAESLTFEVWPSGDIDAALFCSLRVAHGQISAVEARGLGTPPRALRWYARRAEVDALARALRALADGSLASVDPNTARHPAPPFATVTWMTGADSGIAAGLYVQSGLGLPDVLKQVIATVLPGGICAALLVP